MLTVRVSTLSNSQVCLLKKKMWVAFANAKATHIFFSKYISVYTIFNDYDTLTNDIVRFEQLGPEKQTESHKKSYKCEKIARFIKFIKYLTIHSTKAQNLFICICQPISFLWFWNENCYIRAVHTNTTGRLFHFDITIWTFLCFPCAKRFYQIEIYNSVQ